MGCLFFSCSSPKDDEPKDEKKNEKPLEAKGSHKVTKISLKSESATISLDESKVGKSSLVLDKSEGDATLTMNLTLDSSKNRKIDATDLKVNLKKGDDATKISFEKQEFKTTGPLYLTIPFDVAAVTAADVKYDKDPKWDKWYKDLIKFVFGTSTKEIVLKDKDIDSKILETTEVYENVKNPDWKVTKSGEDTLLNIGFRYTSTPKVDLKNATNFVSYIKDSDLQKRLNTRLADKTPIGKGTYGELVDGLIKAMFVETLQKGDKDFSTTFDEIKITAKKN